MRDSIEPPIMEALGIVVSAKGEKAMKRHPAISFTIVLILFLSGTAAISQQSISVSEFTEVEVLLGEQISMDYLESLPKAPGSKIKITNDGKTIRAQIPAGLVPSLTDKGGKIISQRPFMLVEPAENPPNQITNQTSAIIPNAITYEYSENDTDVVIPDDQSWTYSLIDLTAAPSVAVTSMDVHYEIESSWTGYVYADLSDEDYANYTYQLEYGVNGSIYETQTGITAFNGKSLNQLWILWAAEYYSSGDGYIDYWWIKLYYEGGSGYCTASTTSTSYEHISSVVVGTINNPSGSSGYADYTALAASMNIGTGYPITVTNGSPYSNDGCGIWIDWNQDYDFDDAGETISVSGSPGVGPYTATITPPVGAVTGNTRMRVRIVDTNYDTLSPCGIADYGEVEDYTITVNPAVPQYCTATSSQCNPYINYFNISSLNNGPSGCGSGGYSDFTGTQTNLQLGNTYIASIAPGQISELNHTGLWIDWNNDKDFDDAGETITTIDSSSISYAIVDVPEGANLGTTRLRARISTSNPTKCGQLANGETEDYTLNITSGQSEYCDGGGEVIGGDYITAFKLKDINNVTSSSGYGDYASISTQLEKNTAYPFTINTNSGTPTAVWIDWNDDKDFGDPCETISLENLIYEEPPYSSSTLYTNMFYGKIIIPGWVSLGSKRLRIRSVSSGQPEPCGYTVGGEVEDYTIIVSETGTTGEESYGGGNGTSEQPYLIYTANELNKIGLNNYHWAKYFKLMADIDMAELGQPYNIIGNEIFAFEGILDGNKHKISNFTYQANGKHRAGLFGRIAGGASIVNLGFINPDVNVIGGNAVAALVGILEDGTVSNCYVKGGSINGNIAIGAISGGNHGIIENCFCATSVTGSEDFGAVSGLSSGGTTTNSFWDLDAALPATTSAGGTGTSTNDMKDVDTYLSAGWDFENIWQICNGTNYPKLQNEQNYLADFTCPDGVEMKDYALFAEQWMLTILAQDLNGDGIVNFADWSMMAISWDNNISTVIPFIEQWLEPSATFGDIAPAEGDGIVNSLDLAVLAEEWLMGLD